MVLGCMVQELTPAHAIDRVAMEAIVAKLLKTQKMLDVWAGTFVWRMAIQRSIKNLPVEPVRGVAFDQVPHALCHRYPLLLLRCLSLVLPPLSPLPALPLLLSLSLLLPCVTAVDLPLSLMPPPCRSHNSFECCGADACRVSWSFDL